MGLLDIFKLAQQKSNYETLPRDKYMDKEWKRISSKYYTGIEKIESQWSVLYNLKSFTGSDAEKFEMLCKQNINDLFEMQKISNKYESESVPPNVPAFKRLAMLYEKQGCYDKAVSICMDAIKCGASSDGSKGGMQGHMARMIKKSKTTPTEEMKSMMMK